MKAILTVLGTDRTGIIARVSGKLFDNGVNILDITCLLYTSRCV